VVSEDPPVISDMSYIADWQTVSAAAPRFSQQAQLFNFSRNARREVL